MAIGDDSQSVGYQLVPDSGANGRVRYGAREINRTRDYVAVLKKKVDAMPKNKEEYKEAAGVYIGTGPPGNSLGSNGDLYFRYG